MVGLKCLGVYTPLIENKFMWQGKCEITNKTLEIQRKMHQYIIENIFATFELKVFIRA